MLSTVSAGVRKAVRVARADGPDVVLQRVLRKGVERLVPASTELRVLLDDLVTTEGPLPPLPRWRPRSPTDPLLVDVVITPPAPGSGGHTTVFRIVEELERRGHTCRLSLYDRYRGDLARHTEVVRRCWPGVRAQTHDALSGLLPADAVVATSWETAHVVGRRARCGQRFYLVQDFEPDFHAMSSERVLAEATYGFGFVGITAGPWLAEVLKDRYGMRAEGFEFGCDTDVYHLDEVGPRSGVAFYAKPDVPRRAFWLGVLALRAFAERHPGQEVHLFGHAAPHLPFRHTDHGSLSPERLNTLYNRCAAGLVLSLTNVSLIPWEMLASGCVPVVNDAPHNRAVLRNDHVAWSAPAPEALGAALGRAVLQPQDGGSSLRRRASSVQASRWQDAGATVERVLRDAVQ